MNTSTLLSLFTIVGGVLLYESGDVQLNGWGLAAICWNVVAGVVDRVVQKHLLSNQPVIR